MHMIRARGCLPTTLVIALGLATGPALAAPRTFQTDHFHISYDDAHVSDQSQGLVNFDLPPGWDASTLEAVAPGFMTEPNFVRCLACWLEYGYQTYEGDGFRVPADRVPVWVMDLGGSKLGMVVPPLLDWFFLDPGWYTHPVPTQMTMFIHQDQGNTTLMSTAVHELTHVVQLQYWGLYNVNYPAFVEGPAVATENTVIARPFWYWAFCENANHQQPDAGPGFLTMNTDAW
ncbi:hypothetical protein FJY71_07900, partial [candidate division WOR-3 bacterium]|nr:hypothetical protein [candidate division WOR-3 bacterium]